MHFNTVKYRVGRAEARRGRPIAEDRLAVELALVVCHWYCAAVFRPDSAELDRRRQRRWRTSSSENNPQVAVVLNLSHMYGDVVQQQVSEIAEALYRRTDELAPVLAKAIVREVKLYRTAGVVPFAVIANG